MPLDLLFISLLFFSVLCLYTLIKLIKRKIFLFAFIPLTLFLVGSTIYTYSNLLGFPTIKELPDNFLVVSFIVEEPEAIYLWTIKHRKDIPRSYQIPYKKETHKKLIRARKEIRNKGMAGRTVIVGKKSKNNQFAIDFKLYNFMDDKEKDTKKHVKTAWKYFIKED